jgi:hypothetical protein
MSNSLKDENISLSKEEYDKIKLKLLELEKEYKSKIEELALITNELSEIKYKINVCFDLINSYYE